MLTVAFTIENMTIAERVAQLRQERSWSYGQLAERSSLSKGYLYDLERGERNPKEGTRLKLAKAFGLSLLEFMEGVDLGEGIAGPTAETAGASDYPDLIEFEVMMLDTRRRDPRLARTIMKIARELIEDERRNRREEKRADENATKGGSSETT